MFFIFHFFYFWKHFCNLCRIHKLYLRQTTTSDKDADATERLWAEYSTWWLRPISVLRSSIHLLYMSIIFSSWGIWLRYMYSINFISCMATHIKHWDIFTTNLRKLGISRQDYFTNDEYSWGEQDCQTV